ncbi:unnamed protein product [Phyllotreta striolata]|uniref:5'-3' exoribonuclease 1 n=1 Tax=Phyllotreta striolata TaxID=444603 RepID=A0A9N9XQE2_PHYSR|nr:unnamed protein product [Phyllotreta striolata]
MGVPKFFRYISERYPCLSEVVKDYQIPEFDHLYLDMNGIIHNCSHPNDDDPHFRISEETIFQDIFHYIEVLFRLIKPQKLFFMAIDGVAPRAKMNQQRGRRFRSAADAAKAEAEAIKKGEKLPDEARFDSNCITPGTVFMARLHEQLKYFIVDKISNDPLWQNCKVILSGHETPGEGEHKIMDYIRYLRAQTGYDPNTRHCLYGLDADLIMLGLCTHEPHFSLLREEVKFGRKDNKRITVPEEITFFLLHLSLLRDYLELEFSPIRYQLKLFDYDLEKLIDDWVLMGFLVGNDFIPHLPNLHIAEGALPLLYKTYMEVLPTLDGYINEGGKLNLTRFEMYMRKLGEQDMVNFEMIQDDMMYLESKRGDKFDELDCLGDWEEGLGDDGLPIGESPEPEPVRDSGLEALLRSVDEFVNNSEFANFKSDYYKEKLEYANVTEEVLKDQAVGFVRAIQWNLNYYYNGCCSWSWFYPHHYSPYISDIKGFTDSKIEFDMGKPFHPFEQLLAVLPAASKELLPECYHDLMTDEHSKIIDYYPQDFECDLNGKKQAWEAVVKIPFIDEKLLLNAMSTCNDNLTEDEKQRNSHGPMLVYSYTSKNNGIYPAPCYFPEVLNNHTEVKTLTYKEVLVPEAKLIKGAYPGAHMNVYYPGFPTMKHLQYKGEVQMAHVKVFEQPSRNESMMLHIIPESKFAGDLIPVDLLGSSVFVGWPHLTEAIVVAISNRRKKFLSQGGPNQYNVHELKDGEMREFDMSISGINEHNKNRLGILFGDIKVLVYVRQLIGKKFVCNSKGKLELQKQYAPNVSSHPLQSIVYDIKAYDPLKNVSKNVEIVFPKNAMCFTLANPFYGSQAAVLDAAQVATNGRIKVSISVLKEPDLSAIKKMFDNVSKKYKPAHYFASSLGMSNNLFSKITGAIYVSDTGDGKRVNIGLDLKWNKKNKETPGYTRKFNNVWLYTDKTAEIVDEYADKFPEVLEFLSKNHNDEMTVDKVFPEDSHEKLVEIRKWLKSLPTEDVEKTPCNSINLDPDAIAELEKIVDSFDNSEVKKVTMQIKPTFLYRPEIQCGTLEPDPKAKTEILDRVVNVRPGYTVPFGHKGTVTAIRQTTASERDTVYEVVFDKQFKNGLKLNCSDKRGYMLPKHAFVNISYGKRCEIEKIGNTDELMAKAEAFNGGQNGKESGNLGSLIRPQPSFQQPWYAAQRPLGPQSQQALNQASSAFAHFASPNFARPEANDEQGLADGQQNRDKIILKRDRSAAQNKNAGWKKLDEKDVREFFSGKDDKALEKPAVVDNREKSAQKNKESVEKQLPGNWREQSAQNAEKAQPKPEGENEKS